MIAGIIFGIGCFVLMVRYSATKSVVITEEHELTGEGNLEPLIEKILEEMKQYRYEEAAGELFGELQAAVENIDIDACTGLLERWEAMY